jgi:mono/diheme cytochrome c family protein
VKGGAGLSGLKHGFKSRWTTCCSSCCVIRVYKGQGLRGARRLVEDAVVQRLNDRARGDRPGGVPQEPQTSLGSARGPSRSLRPGVRETMHRRVRALLTMRVVLVLIAAGHAAAALAVIGYAGWGLWAPFSRRSDVAIVVVPSLSATAEAGRTAYERRCLQCHGLHGAGTAAGPPLVHSVYRPAHHADVAFALAVRRGVRAHHWRFGDMPPQADASLDEVKRSLGTSANCSAGTASIERTAGLQSTTARRERPCRRGGDGNERRLALGLRRRRSQTRRRDRHAGPTGK